MRRCHAEQERENVKRKPILNNFLQSFHWLAVVWTLIYDYLPHHMVKRWRTRKAPRWVNQWPYHIILEETNEKFRLAVNTSAWPFWWEIRIHWGLWARTYPTLPGVRFGFEFLRGQGGSVHAQKPRLIQKTVSLKWPEIVNISTNRILISNGQWCFWAVLYFGVGYIALAARWWTLDYLQENFGIPVQARQCSPRVERTAAGLYLWFSL